MNLQPQHLTHLKTSAITDEILAERGYHSIMNAAKLNHMAPSQRIVPAIGIPIYQLGEHFTTLIRPHRPREITNSEGKTKIIKYEYPAGTPRVLDVLPRFRDALTDVSIPIWFTEGAKKADALASHNSAIVPISINGVWGWMEKDGKDIDGNRYMLPDFRRLAIRGRRVVLAFDSDYQVNEQVRMALDEFTKVLEGRGAIVGILQLPHGDKKLGVDDAFADGWTVDEIEQAVLWRDASAALALTQTAVVDKLRRENEHLHERLQWMLAALSNKDLTNGERLTLLFTTLDLWDRRNRTGQHQPEQPVPVMIKRIADESGQSPGVVGRHIKNLEKAGAWKRECHKVPDAKTGNVRTEVRLTPAPVLERPRNIKPPEQKNWGGKRVTCRKCGSGNLVLETRTYCAECNHVHHQSIDLVNQPMPQVAGSASIDVPVIVSEQIAPHEQRPFLQISGSSATREAADDITSSPLTIDQQIVGREPMRQDAGQSLPAQPAAHDRPPNTSGRHMQMQSFVFDRGIIDRLRAAKAQREAARELGGNV